MEHRIETLRIENIIVTMRTEKKIKNLDYTF